MRSLIGPITAFHLAALPCLTAAQSSPNCPILGPVFPPPSTLLNDSAAISETLAQFSSTMRELDRNRTLAEFNTTFYFQVFSASDKLFNYSYAPPPMADFLTSGTLDDNTVFRIGSVSKLITVYTLLAEAGMEHMHDPVTKWVPELAAMAGSYGESTSQKVRWNEVTIGQLAGQLAGVKRDLGLGDLSTAFDALGEDVEQYGLPVLQDDEKPNCGVSNLGLPPCSRREFFKGISSFRPVAPTSHTPIYSNIAYQILAYAVEGMTNRTFKDSLQSSILDPLGLKRTSLEAPPKKDNVVIPEGEDLSWWSVTTGGASPYGGMFSTASDLTILGQSILNSTLLSGATTRAWLKPVTHTSDLQMSVGVPWEIRRMLLPLSPDSNNTRVVDLYTKNGILGMYSSILALSPDHGLGFVVMLAGASAGRLNLYVTLPELIAQTMVPAFEEAAREQAAKKFAGLYESSGVTLTLGVDEGLPGLVVRNWTKRDVDVLQAYGQFMWPEQNVTPGLRLYPTGIEKGGKVSFRGVYELEGSSTTNRGPFVGGCMSWGGIDTPTYGSIGFDDFEFVLDDSGKTVGITLRVFRETLRKVQ
ncbi:uncharacterized protein Z518_09446 [Rhinocladiella mackenziei CBS 650.93]|uniref:Beta-lactamase-related domain-containing protein n=1 Tax=Rhinocladiella mackenziei CBS 650.93 TaxID=1442369 RepID=A0A0D2IYM1_9EURO|nr:uncharacterized protein Z518_09446 [Rhinocladiella mackenziei CBS 650.93]KIX01720.1 hypothetical protein Z518_09446 [Rhinocladiella mackenziei CBS 650.93]